MDSKAITETERETVLRALARCKHSSRLGYRTLIVGLIDFHKAWPAAPLIDHQADALDLLRFVYRHQLAWPIGLYEPPISRCTNREIGLTKQVKMADGRLVGAQDEYGNPIWLRWDGCVPSPSSKECRI